MRKAHTFLAIATVLGGSTIGLLAGCTNTHPQGFGPEEVSTTHRLARAHILPMNKPGVAQKKENPTVAAAEHKQAAATNAQLTYQGGPLIQSVKVYVVFWGTGQDSSVTSGIGQYFTDITNSVYFDWLSEYDANGMHIGRGSYAGSYNITPSVTGTTIDDSQIQSELAAQISAGHLPQPDANSLYMTYFPPGVTITMGGSQSCSAFCAYHGTTSNNVYYGVMPDLGGACAGGCYGSDIFTSNTVVSSHEMIEAVTDPGVGTGNIGWYDNTNGEIGDICVGQGGTIGNYQVQLEWSNANNACIDQSPGGGSSSGGSSSGGSGSGSSSSSSSSGSSSGGSSSSGSSGGSSSSGSSGGSSSSSGSGGSSSGSGSGGSSSSGGSSGGSTSSSGGGSSGGGTCASEQEPNDTPDEADDLSGGCVSGSVDPGSDVDFAAFQLSDGQTYDVQLAASGDANVVLYKWVGYWGQVASTSSTEITHTSQGGGYYITEVFSPGQQTQSYQVTLTVQ